MNTRSKTRLFEEHQVSTAGGDVLHAMLMLPRPPTRPRRLVFMAPLIGAGASQSLLTFRNLTRRGSVLFSFEYRGHPRSTGAFELDQTIVDVKHALVWAWNYANDRGLPLHGFSTCYGTVPLLAQFVGNECGVLLKSFSVVSGLFRLDHILRFEDFAPVLSRHLGREISPPDLFLRVADGTLDTSGDPFRQALLEFLGRLFPELRVGRDYFEELQYERVNMAQTILQFSRSRYLDGVTVPPWLPCNFFYGRNDELLSLHLPEGREAYRRQVRSLVPHAVLYESDLDHFGRGPDHDPVMDRLADIFELYDNAPIPGHHFNQSVRSPTARV